MTKVGIGALFKWGILLATLLLISSIVWGIQWIFVEFPLSVLINIFGVGESEAPITLFLVYDLAFLSIVVIYVAFNHNIGE